MKAFQRFYQLLIISLLVTLNGFSQVTSAERYIPGEAIVQFRSTIDVKAFAERINSASDLQLLPERALSRSLNIWLFKYDPSISRKLLLDNLYAQKEVAKAQLNHIPEERLLTPNDPGFTYQWNMLNTGQSGGIPGVDVDATLAWDITTGGFTKSGDTIVVAVVDGGFLLSHPDLDFYKNYHDIPNNGIDDDLNGYVDDYNGWNAYTQTGNITSQTHGTHVSGIIGAKGNNGLGAAGVNWKVKIMPVMGSTTSEAVAIEAYSYIYDMRLLYNTTNGLRGAFVVSTNSSFGVDGGQPADFPIWCSMYDSLGKIGVLSAGATANQRWNIDQTGDIPTACASDYLITVTNTDRLDSLYSSAGYGLTTIDLGAPGTQIYSTTAPSGNPSYSNLTGTSMATPHVAGTVALMMSAACTDFVNNYKLFPDSFALIIKQLILNNTDVIPSLSGKTVTGGRLNIYKSVNAISNYGTCSGSSVDERSASIFDLHFFPNPAQSELNLIDASKTTLVIYDAAGRVVLTKNIIGAQQNIDISNLNSGIYILNCIGDNKFMIGRLVKN